MEGHTDGILLIVSLAIVAFFLYLGRRIVENVGEADWKFLIPASNGIVSRRLLELAKSRGGGTGLMRLAPLFDLILAFGDATYDGPAGAEGTKDPTQQRQTATQQTTVPFQRIDRGLRFFLCFSGFLAAVGFMFKLGKYPNWELFMQLGFYGGAAGLVFMGVLQLLQAFVLAEEPILQRLIRGAGFLLAISGAPIILGYIYVQQSLLDYGLMASVGALAVTSLLLLREVFTWSNQTEAPTETG